MSHVDGATAGAARRRRERRYGDHEHGAAWRRRQRRLRMHWRHEQLTLQMLLATLQHHSAPRGQTTARSGGEARVALHGQVPEAPLPQGGQPAPLSEVAGWQDRVQRHTVDQIVDAVPGLLIPVTLDGPVPPPLMVEVPTIVSFSSLQRIMEQTVDIPAPRGRGRRGGLQDFFPGQSSTAAADVDIPVPRGDLQGFLPGQGFTASSSLSGAADEAGQGVFRTFPHGKKVRSAGQVSADLPRHISSWTPAAYEQPRGSIEQEKEKEKEEAEYERRMQVLNRRVRDDIPLSPTEYAAWRRWSGLPPLPSSSAGKRRKRKKRRKRRLPRSPRPLLLGRARRRQRQWYAGNARFTGYDAPRVMFLFAVHVVQESSGAPVPVLRQFGGYSWYACSDVYPQWKLCRRPSRSSRCCSWTVPPTGIGGVGFGLLSYLDTKHIIYKLFLPIVRGLGMSWIFRPSRAGSTAGRACPQFQLRNPP